MHAPGSAGRDVTLVDGRRVQLRPIQSDDAPRLRALYERLSPESLYYRFFSPVPPPTERQLRMLTEVDSVTRAAMVAMLDDEVVGVARYDRDRDVPERAEVAVIVQDDLQRKGLGTALMRRLADAARAGGIRTFTATVLPENQRALGLFEREYQVAHRLAGGNVEIEFPIV